ncbi:hypothetical protein TSUD_60690 [Trifolium subterraneum]|uniref:Uncharacterized protein n=1 Tax=Trifolium subterraneum TaxID=3900 RepID=A0A2Z6N5X5_TRISU|nr:hypothetical protein TSUD_60690 [Trifolium subterraneum]
MFKRMMTKILDRIAEIKENQQRGQLIGIAGGNTQPVVSQNSFAALSEQEVNEEGSQKRREDEYNTEDERNSGSTQAVQDTQFSSSDKGETSAENRMMG